MLCRRCRKEVELSDKLKQDRIAFGVVENLCSMCFRYVKTFGKDLPDELKYFGTKSNPIPWELFQKHRSKFQHSSKLYVSVKCVECGKLDIRRIDKVLSSKYTGDVEVCNDCVMHYVCNQDKWKEVNSQAQAIVQNKPKTKQKQRLAMSDLEKNDKLFALKRSLGDSRFLKGFYKGLYFASSYELSFLVEHRSEDVRYCFLKVPYIFHNKTYTYTPDFIISDKIFEIKGNITERDEAKIKAAKKMFGDRFVLLDQHSVKFYFKTLDSLNVIEDELIVTNFPKRMENENSKFYIKNHPKIKSIKDCLLCLPENQARQEISFYTKKIPQGCDFHEFYVNLLNDNSFLKYYLLFRIYDKFLF